MFLNLKFSPISVLHCATHRSWALITNIDHTLLFLFIPSCFYMLPITRQTQLHSHQFPLSLFCIPISNPSQVLQDAWDRLFTFISFKFQPFKLLMKVQSKVFQVQTLGGIRMDLPLSLVLSHILAIKIRYRSCSCCLFVCLFVCSFNYISPVHLCCFFMLPQTWTLLYLFVSSPSSPRCRCCHIPLFELLLPSRCWCWKGCFFALPASFCPNMRLLGSSLLNARCGCCK